MSHRVTVPLQPDISTRAEGIPSQDPTPTRPVVADALGPIPGLLLVTGGALLALAGASTIGLSPLVLAVLIGAIVGNTGLATPRTEVGLRLAARRLLRIGIVLLGLRLSLSDVVGLGSTGVAVVLTTVVITFIGTQAIGRRLGLPPSLSLLVATGYSICGASAIAAVKGATDADDEDVAVAVGLVTLFGSLAIITLPALAGPLGLTDDQFGIWVGASVHDVAQVAATASGGGASVAAIAMVVKLTRVLLLAPLVFGVHLHRSRRRTDRADDSASVGAGRPPLIPLFVAGFVASVGWRTTGLLPAGLIDGARPVETALFAAALVGLGSGVRINRLRRLGLRPLVLGALAWALVATVSYVGVLLAFAP